MPLVTMDGFDFDHEEQPDYPTWTPAETKENMNKRGEELRIALNAVINILNSTSPGTSGASNTAMTPITAIGEQSNVQSVVDAIVARLQSVTSGLSGAEFIGAETIDGLTGGNVQMLIESLKTLSDAYNMAQTLSLSTHKLSSDHDGRYYTEAESDGKFETKDDLANNRKLSDDGNFMGSWYGISNPALADPGIAGVVESHTAQLAETANVVWEFGADNTGVIDATQSFINAIASLKTDEYTGKIPTQAVKRKLIIPAGRYKISGKIVIPSYIHISGQGRHTTFLESYITNGDPVLDVINGDVANHQFYNTIEELTVNGRNQNCMGIRIYETSRWTLRNVVIQATNYEGLYAYKSYLGDVYSIQCEACGTAVGEIRYPAIRLTGDIAFSGSHAISFFGGEIHGGAHGLYASYGVSCSLFGMTVEGVAGGIGIVNDGAHSLLVDGCYFEGNKEDIVEIGQAISGNYIHNYFGPLAVGGRGNIGVTYAIGCSIVGNFFSGTSSTVRIFDATLDATGALQTSTVSTNHGQVYPLNISASLITNSVSKGNVIQTFDNDSSAYYYGYVKYKDRVIFQSDLYAYGGINRIRNRSALIDAGDGTPEGALTVIKGLYFNMTGKDDNSVYFKKGANANAFEWLPAQLIKSSTTTNRPTTVTTVGYQMFDITLGKPIWLKTAPSTWVDATGATV